MMRRREFVALLGCAATASFSRSLPARAQQPTVPVIGYLQSAASSYFAQFATAVRDGLKEMGYIEGQNVVISYRSAEGHYERLPALVADLIERRVDVIFAAGVRIRQRWQRLIRAKSPSCSSARPIR
jgi:putative ABC transport system substrate-binding protein